MGCDGKYASRCARKQKQNQRFHSHLSFVSLTADKRLSAKDIIGNKKKLTWWQDEFWKHMVKKYPDLERGESASETGRGHIPPRIFKEMARLNKQRAKLDELLGGVNAFNAKAKAEEIGKLLDEYIPGVEKMQTQLKKYSGAFTETVSENRKLKKKNAELSQSLSEAKSERVLKHMKDLQLQRDYNEAIATLDRIPPEVLKVYAGVAKQTKKEVDRENDR